MNLNFMRFVDRWVGALLCCLCSVFYFIARLFGRGAEFKTKSILFIELSEMGSTIIAYSAIKRIINDHPDAEFYFLTFERNRECVELLPEFDKSRILTISDKSFYAFLTTTLSCLVVCRRVSIDTAVDFELFSRFTALFSFLSGAKKIVGFDNLKGEGLYRGNFISHKVYYNPYLHMSQNFYNFSSTLKLKNLDEPLLKTLPELESPEVPHFEPNLETCQKIKSNLSSLCDTFNDGSKLIVFNPDPGGFLPIRAWPNSHYIDLAKKLLNADSNNHVVICGLEETRDIAKEICEGVGESRCIDYTGKTKTLKEMICLFVLSEALVSIDSGPAHCASLTDIKSFVLFGPETPSLYSPVGDRVETFFQALNCSPCLSAVNNRNTSCRSNVCLQQISPQKVFERVSESLSN